MAASIGALQFTAVAHAEQTGAFVDRIHAAYESVDKTAALKELFHFDGVDAETMKLYDERTIGRLLARYDSPSVALEPVPDDADFSYVSNGFEYRPNLKILGYVVLNGRTKAPYGLHDGRHFFVGVTRSAISPAPPPDKLLQMMVVGMGHPPVTFDGFCDVIQGNGKTRRMALEHRGRGNTTAAIMAQRIERCEITNTSGRGSLLLQLSEGPHEVFRQRIEAPDARIRYRR